MQTEVAAAQRDLGKVEAGLDRVGASAARVGTSSTIGKTEREAAAAGAAAARAARQFQDLEKRTAAAAGAGRTGVSAGQQQAAMRMLPAQITDITTQLASGAPIWLTFLQQGGQIKDSFGGIVPTFKALAGAINPVTIGIAALTAGLGAAAVAVIQIQRETGAYNAALEASNNIQGFTVDQLRATAKEVSGVTGTTGAAAAAVAQLAATGRVSGQDLRQAATIALQAQRLLGREVEDTVRIYADLGRDPVQTLLKLNEGTNFLTASVLRQVRAYVEVGNVQAAGALAQQTWADQQQRVLADAERNLGSLERAWQKVGSAAKAAWDAILDIGREKGPEERLDAAQRELARRQALFARGTVRSPAEQEASLAPLRAEIAAATLEKAQADAAAQERGQETALNQRKRRIAEQIAALTETVKTNREKFEEEKKRLDEALALKVIEKPEYDKLLTASAAKFKDPKTAADPVQTAFEQQRLRLTEQLAAAKQKLANEQGDVAATQDQATAKLDAWLTTSKEALQLNAAQVKTLRDLATQTDLFGRASTDLDQQKKRDTRIADGMAAVEAQLADVAGRSAEQITNELTKRFRKLREDLAAAGDKEGLIKVDKLIDISAARAQLEDLQAQVSQIFGEQGRVQQTVQAEVTAGLTSEYEGRQRLLAINASTVSQIEALLPRMRELAAITGNPLLAAGVAELEAKLEAVKIETETARGAFQDAFQSGMRSSINDLALGVSSLEDAVKGFVRSVAEAMVDFAAKKIAAQATDAVMGGFDTTLKTIQSLVPAIQAAETAKVAADTTMAASGVAATTTAAGAATAAGAEVAAANAPAAAATATWSFGTAAVAGLIALAALLAFAKGSFADGGYTGPGGKYQPAGVVHAGEHVTRQEIVRQPGARQFLDDFNTRGMDALRSWQGYADGGLVTSTDTPSFAGFKPSTPSIDVTAKGGDVLLRNINVLDPGLLDDWVNSSSGEKTMVNWIRRNRGAVKSMLD
nr:phage tail length tape measure family protein [Rubrivivax gelatinosus]